VLRLLLSSASPHFPFAAATWPGLVEVYLRHLEGELERGVATSSNAAMRLFKKLMAAAEDGSRTGGLRSRLLWCSTLSREMTLMHPCMWASQVLWRS
jgi:hypothetical protein